MSTSVVYKELTDACSALELKPCNRSCLCVKPTTEFHKDHEAKDGLLVRCNECNNNESMAALVRERKQVAHDEIATSRIDDSAEVHDSGGVEGDFSRRILTHTRRFLTL